MYCSVPGCTYNVQYSVLYTMYTIVFYKGDGILVQVPMRPKLKAKLYEQEVQGWRRFSQTSPTGRGASSHELHTGPSRE